MTKRNKAQSVNTRWEKKNEKGRQTIAEEKGYLKPPIQAKNPSQRDFLRLLKEKQVVAYVAPAGVGKTYAAMSEVTDWLKRGAYDKIILSRPHVGMGNTGGLLPGSVHEKYEPYMLPLVDVISSRYGKGFYESCLHNGTIEIQPLEYIRGRSFNDVVVLDESQNVTPSQMYTILTRIGESGRLIILGDPTQNDLKGENGLTWLSNFMFDNPELGDHIGIVEATSDEIVRSGLCKTIVKAKERSFAL